MAKNKKNLKQNILITGGSGFIGSALTKYLVENSCILLLFSLVLGQNSLVRVNR